MKMIDFLLEAMKEGKTGIPSTKRVGHMAGISITFLIAGLFAGIVAGLSIQVSAADFQFVYSQLLNTILILSGMLMGAGTTAYIATKKTEQGEGNDDGKQ